MSTTMRPRPSALLSLLAICVAAAVNDVATAAEPSADTQACLDCHAVVTPGIVADWQDSRHARVTPAAAVAQEPRQRRISTESVPAGLAETVVGCAECHTMNADEHPDSFEHNGYVIHTVVSPADCAGCHPVEVAEFADNLMGQAHGNLVDNPLYRQMVDAVNGAHVYERGAMTFHGSDPVTDAESCLSCHGTEVKVVGLEVRDTDFGEMEIPVLSGWPNGGVGRVNPDGSKGACSACHARHRFSIEMARKPYTCAQCHKGPDVPAYPVYEVSVHGKIQKSLDKDWDYEAVPWTVGRDFTVPTCATCHASEVVDEQGETLARRSHRMNDRLPWRIFGLPYAHPHPVAASTAAIVNAAGLNLPTNLDGTPAGAFLIDADEMAARQGRMVAVCLGCHSGQWVDGHFTRLDKAIETTNHLTLQATKLLGEAWAEGLAAGIPQKASPFDEAIELKWVEQWLFYGNSVRFASAMGGADYGVFADGRWAQHRNLQEMLDYLGFLRAGKAGK